MIRATICYLTKVLTRLTPATSLSGYTGIQQALLWFIMKFAVKDLNGRKRLETKLVAYVHTKEDTRDALEPFQRLQLSSNQRRMSRSF